MTKSCGAPLARSCVTGNRGRFVCLVTLSALLATLGPITAADAATLAVGPGKRYATIASAVAAARDGDVVEVQAGTYTNDFVTISRRISIVGVGGMARLVATVAIPNGKGIVITRADATLSRLEFNGARVSDRNGAGIRYEGGNLTVQRCYFKNNENGILANPVATGQIHISSSEFDANGRGDGYTHGIYTNKIAQLTVMNSYLHDTKVGHHIKSRAARTVIDGNRIVDGTNGTASYNVDVPNGGTVLINGNDIVQGAASQNPALVHFGGESAPYAGSSLQVTNNTMQNFRSSASGVLNATSIAVTVSGNRRYALSALLSGPGTTSNNPVLSQPVSVPTTSPWK